eukprot:2887249-Alexandrium_andersonii.AAC.1
MSASLVGSEMCIRDRYFAKASHFHRGQAHFCQGQHIAAKAKNLFAKAASVSYTHLTLPTICSV